MSSWWLPLVAVTVPFLTPGAGQDTARVDQFLTSPVAAKLVRMQNQERAALRLTNLRWDPALEVAAAGYAKQLAATDKWQHSPDESRVGQGENLWMGTRGAFALDEMVGAWLAERSMFRPGTFPAVSKTGDWEDVGHYTQIIWPGDRRVGCSISSSAKYDYLVCRYAGPGNVMGERLLQSDQLASSE